MKNWVATTLFALTAWAIPTLASAGEEQPAPHEAWEHLWHELLIDLWVIGIVFGIAAGYMLFKYRAKSPEDVGNPPTLSKGQVWAWALVPVFLFMADDFYLAAKGWSLWNLQRTVPENSMEVKVTGMQWSWEFEYENGVISDTLMVPVGRPIVLRMSSSDVLHSFGLHAYRVKEDLMPGRITYLWFMPNKPLKTFVTCTEYCGMAHAEMQSDVIAVPEEQFNEWLEKEAAEASASREGSES